MGEVSVSPPGPRWVRMAVASVAALVTSVSLLGGLGVIPAAQDSARAEAQIAPVAQQQPSKPNDVPGVAGGRPATGSAAWGAIAAAVHRSREKQDTNLPPRSGRGRRVVFSESRQRVWLVTGQGRVRSTYLVSGSVYDNLDPGTFEVWSRSENAVGIDDSGTMKFFVRFARGNTGAAIGFHDIPINDGRRVQGFDQLGTAQSHGCIRQRRTDAQRLWAFAPIGTQVVVTS